MIPEKIISELLTIELMAEDLRQKCYSIRTDLERFSAPAPSGVDHESHKKIIDILNKRRKNYYKTKNNKHE
jgi:2-polyprenyl-3-methyl-5-hydroxy-6-metoxy-1,4-benzoquinol methylase